MKINIPKVVVPVDLRGYAPELDGHLLQVWVNPPMRKIQEYNDLVAALQAQELEAAKDRLFPQKQEQETGESKGPLQRVFEQVAHWARGKPAQPEGLDARLLAWYAEIWSQGPAESRWTVDELQELETQDPSFLQWMIAQTWKARVEHIERKKKA